MEKKRGNLDAATRIMREQKYADGIPSDILGSYTGVDEDEDMPVQDADDL